MFKNRIEEAISLSNNILKRNHDNPAFFKYPSTLLRFFTPTAWLSRLDLASRWISLDPLSIMAIEELYTCYLRGMMERRDLQVLLEPCRPVADFLLPLLENPFRSVLSDLLTSPIPPAPPKALVHEEPLFDFSDEGEDEDYEDEEVVIKEEIKSEKQGERDFVDETYDSFEDD